MDYPRIANGFSFRFVRPQDEFSGWWLRIAGWYRRFGGAFDLLNARFPEEARGVKSLLGPLCRIPRMSSGAIGALIHLGVAGMAPGESFVNVGVWNGFTLLAGMVGNADKPCVGVDNFSQFGGPKDDFLQRFVRFKSANHRFFDMDYEQYFASVHRGPIGFYMYDGEHSYRHQLDGLRAAEPFFGTNAVVMVDDTNDPEPRDATEEFVRTSANRYEVILDVTTRGNQHPTWWNGVMLLRRVG